MKFPFNTRVDDGFHFPSLSFAGRRTIAPGELAARLAVPESHVDALVRSGLLVTRRRFLFSGERWIAVEPMKEFLLSRVCGHIIEASHFLAPVPYLIMLKCHQEMAAAVGDSWKYPVINKRMFTWPAFVPKSMAITGQTALSLPEVCRLLRCDEGLLFQRVESYRLPGAIDLRQTEGERPLHRVPVEAYRFWMTMLFTLKTDCLLLAQPHEVVRDMYRELGEFLGGQPV